MQYSFKGFHHHFTCGDSIVAAEPISRVTGRDDFLDTFSFTHIVPSGPGTSPVPDPEVPDPLHPTKELPQQVILGQVAEHYEDYGSGLSHRMLSVLNFRETLDYYITRVRPMGDIFEFLQLQQIFTAVLVKSPLNVKVAHGIAVTDTNSSETIRPQSNEIGIGQLISFTKESTRAFTDTLGFQEFLTAYKVSNQWINPGIGTPSSANTITLVWDVNTLTLRNPKLGDTSSYEAVRIQRNTRGNDLIVYRDAMWPDKEVLHFDFEYLSLEQATGLLEFMRLSLGHKITLSDQYNRNWEGYILTPESEVIQSKRVGFGASFDFQGRLL